MNFEVLGALAIAIAIAVPLTTALAVKYVPCGEVYESSAQPKLSELWDSLRRNPPFQVFVLMYVFLGLAGGISGVLSFMYMDTHLGIGNRYTELFLPAVLIGPLSLPLWVWALNRCDRHRLTATAFAVYALIMPLSWFVEPGPGAFWPMLVYFTALSVFMPLLMVTMPTILGDVIDFDELRTGKNRAGQYNAFLALIAKGTSAIGGPLALMLVGWFGFQPGAAANSEDAVAALRIVYILLPGLLVVPGVLMLWYFPINARKQHEIHAQLQARSAARSTAT